MARCRENHFNEKEITSRNLKGIILKKYISNLLGYLMNFELFTLNLIHFKRSVHNFLFPFNVQISVSLKISYRVVISDKPVLYSTQLVIIN